MEAVGRLAGGVAHDFNNILSVILSYTELLLEDLKPEDPFRADLGEIHKAGLRAAALTRQLLAFSRQQVLQPRVIDLNETLEGLETMLRRLLGEDIELALRTTDRTPRGLRRSGTARAGDHEPGGQRARRDAHRRQADDRDGERRSR